MANAAIAFLNLSDATAAVIGATTEATLMPVSNLKQSHVARKYRSTGNSTTITINLGSQQNVDTVALMGLNLTVAGTVRVRVTNSGDVTQYDTGTVGGVVDPSYGMYVGAIPSVVSVQYVYITLSDATLSYIEAGRVFVGLRHSFDGNFAPGWSRRYVDRSRSTESRGGQLYVDRDNTYREFDLTFEWVTDAELTAFVEPLDRISGTHSDVLLMTDPAATNMGRFSVWGLLTEISPIVQPYTSDIF